MPDGRERGSRPPDASRLYERALTHPAGRPPAAPEAASATTPATGLDVFARLGILLLTLGVGAFLTLPLWSAPHLYVVSGHTWDAHHLTATTGRDDGGLLGTAVSVRPPTPMDIVRSWVTDDVVFVPSDTIGGLASVRASRGSGAERFERSRRAAWTAAHRCVGLDDPAGPPSAPRSTVGGASGGLMMALAYVEMLSGESPESGPVSGTGAIDDDGHIRPVAQVGTKVRAASAAGASLVLVPTPNAGGVLVDGIDVRVIGVGSLDEALRALGRPGCRTTR